MVLPSNFLWDIMFKKYPCFSLCFYMQPVTQQSFYFEILSVLVDTKMKLILHFQCSLAVSWLLWKMQADSFVLDIRLGGHSGPAEYILSSSKNWFPFFKKQLALQWIAFFRFFFSTEAFSECSRHNRLK